ncbi:MAG: PocR ligand-binding domain-containing protein, partial [Calditrichia bacterium]|nr:PocR ligand-binding domain-containing protein [Calditrichia bacterium]
MPKYKITDLIDIQKFQESMEYCYKATGLPSAILDSHEKILVASGWMDICTKYHRCHPVTEAYCKESDAYIKAHLLKIEYVNYRCKNGLWDIAFPIIIDGEHLATFFFGQFFYEDDPPDIEYFRNQAEKMGFNVEDDLKALNKVPLISREKVENITAYYKSIAGILIEMGMTQKKQIEINKELEKSRRNLQKSEMLLNETQQITKVGGWEYDVETKEMF